MDIRAWLLSGVLILGFASAFWVVGPAFRGPAIARRDLGTHRLALGSMAVVLLANVILSVPIAALGSSGGLTATSFTVAALATQIPLLTLPLVRVLVPGALSPRELGLRLLPVGRVIGIGVATGIVALVLSASIGLLMTQLGVRQNQLEGQFGFLRNSGLPGFLLVLFLGAVMAPIAEELFFRGYVFGMYCRRYPLWVAYAASGALFSVVHANPQVGDLVQNVGLIVPVFALGSLLAWTYQRTGSLLPSMVAHGVNNGIALTAFYVAGIG